MKRVLLTGATGFVGRQCVPLLVARGYEVHAVTSKDQAVQGEGVQWHRADLLDPVQVAALVADVRPSHLLHLAWYTVPGRYWASPKNIDWLQAGLVLLRAFAEHGGLRAVVAGTCAEYDWQYGYCSEHLTPLAPATLYGACKHALQTTLAAYARQAGFSSAWGRLFFLYGPHEASERLVAAVIRALLKGETARCSHGNQIRDFLYVEDAAGALIALLESRVEGPVNVASGLPVAVKSMIWQIADHLGRRDLIQLGAVPVSATEPALLVADVSRLTQIVGWQPGDDLDRGLTQTIAWWKGRLSREQNEAPG
jgi:nucleoside-diphosphate-sugar epimerase